ncbi:SigE family RNA polymerase sigma factor [Streptomyces litchfieldiae]|uniref:SigE family RNA polymerase sigma factor n=1 Tax=Streptomyces litchfieldiae TaxID=3075543 RepID=A0ABU2MND6_9ACTN|nr:SigE family RNA polymerase sigma factor [Streptomyces sp. DSM 44938]MDT0342443.1 SigE family RNA polymerase sigma factor [Streptomyces sp. DSM 44938]
MEDDFQAFMESRWPALLRTAYLLTGNRDDAEDLAQAALARAFSKWSRVRRADDPAAYVWRIMINANVDRLRRLKFRESPTSSLPERPAADRSDELVTRGALLDALGRLPTRQRAVIVLRYVEDRTETEVADLLGIGVGTVRSHAARALARLRADGALRDFLPDPSGTGEMR